MGSNLIKRSSFVALGLLACLLPASGAWADPAAKQAAATAKAVDQWRKLRFGMFIHWGPVSLTGHEIGWSRGRETPSEEYDELYKQFAPTDFDADAWVRIAKAAGMKYMVITSKHHDGFCLWPSKYTDYHVGATPLKRDVLRELSQACKRQGIQFCTYYSLCDWYHPDYPLGSPGGKSNKPQPNMPRYYQYVKNQMKEIIDNYGPLGIMWCDGEWERPWTREHGNQLYDYLKTIQPNLVINNRISKGRQGMSGTTKQTHLNAGDYDTPEQRIGDFNRERPWESCMTIGRQWSWKPNDDIKSLQQCLQTLLYTAGGDGNLLFNVGPMPDGRIEPRQADRLREMGQWLAKYGEGVYGTRGGPFKPGHWGASTCRDNRIYLFVMNWPQNESLLLPAIDIKVSAATTLAGLQVNLKQTNQGISVNVPADQRDPIATVIRLTVASPAQDIGPTNGTPR